MLPGSRAAGQTGGQEVQGPLVPDLHSGVVAAPLNVHQDPILAPGPELHLQAVHTKGLRGWATQSTSQQEVTLLSLAQVVIEAPTALQGQCCVRSDSCKPGQQAD